MKKATTKKASPRKWWQHPVVRKTGLFVLIPALIYFVLFCVFTWPWISHFNTHFFTDAGDGLQNVWNMWWIEKSLTQLDQLPWHTTYLHAPFGVTLVGQTLNPINGFMGVLLQSFMSLVQAFNTMIIFSFVFGGISMFWLCRYFTKSYIASLVGGAVFTFSSYHFAHAIGHMQLVSLEFLPLYILFFWKFLKKPSYLLAVGVVTSLLLVIFSDYYYFLYVLMLSAFILGYLFWRKEIAPLNKKEHFLPWILLVVLSLAFIAPLPVTLLLTNHRDFLMGGHDARIFSTDVGTPVINGGFWRFGWLTEWYYRRIKGFTAETTIYVGLSIILLYVIAMWKRTKIHKDVVFWIGVSAFFGIMSLGPRLLVAGRSYEGIPMPYVIMEHLIPGLKISGMPVRMMVMVTFCSAIITAMVLAKLDLKKRRNGMLLGAFLAIFVIEMLPARLPLTQADQPHYVAVLKSLPATGAVLDNAAESEPEQLYNQTIHNQKMILGYISRTPTSVYEKEKPISTLFAESKFDAFCSQFSLRYITTPASRPLQTSFPVIYQDSEAIIYDIKNAPNC